MDNIEIIGAKEASLATTDLPDNSSMYYSICYNLADGRVFVRAHTDRNDSARCAKNIIIAATTTEHMSADSIEEAVRTAVSKIPPVRRERLRCGLTQKDLATRAGVNITQVQKVESGAILAGNMSAKTIFALADVLGVDPRVLVQQP